MYDATRVLMDAICVAVLAILLFWGARAIASVPLTLPATSADCEKPAAPPTQVTTASGLPGLNLADCGEKEKK
jgi:hypothetical protein